MVETIDDILKRRASPTAPSNLAERIIQASRQQAKPADYGRFSFRAWLETFFEGFLMPRPAVAMFMLLFVGAVLGVYVGAHIESSNAITQEELFSSIYSEQDFNAGEWL